MLGGRDAGGGIVDCCCCVGGGGGGSIGGGTGCGTGCGRRVGGNGGGGEPDWLFCHFPIRLLATEEAAKEPKAAPAMAVPLFPFPPAAVGKDNDAACHGDASSA